MLYSFQAGVLFVHVSRTGGISIQTCMRRGLNDSTVLGTSAHAPLCEARAELGALFDSTFKFAIVRNPWDRLVSWFSFISSISPASELRSGSQADPDSPHWHEFDAYLDAVLKETCTIDGAERLVMSQFHQLADAEEQLLTNDVGRFETLTDDALRLFGMSGLRCPPLQKLNSSTHLHYSKYYSEFGRELVSDLLKDDIEHFGYRFEPVTE
jgi:chondroitin 4-sulfotransferase 11